jgi:hypothetical protein
MKSWESGFFRVNAIGLANYTHGVVKQTPSGS